MPRLLTPAAEREARVKQWRLDLESAIDRGRWIASGTLDRLLEKYPDPHPTFRGFGMHLFSAQHLDEIRADFANHNQAFLEKQKVRLKPFFDTVEKNPLTDEQVHACVCMDDAVQIVAAAGSGKTSTMVAKTGYVLTEGLAAPEEILLLAFNKAAAEELGERVRDRLSGVPGIEKVTARTFSAFGLSVIGQATEQKPTVAPWLEQPGQDAAQILDIVAAFSDKDPTFKKKWDLYRTVYGRETGRVGAPESPEDYANGRRGFLTARGEIVKSKQERQIANWLFYHGIEYAYEQPYEHPTATASHGQYKPDFYYPQIKLYHEHFALNAKGLPPAHFEGDYLQQRQWKLTLHKNHQTEIFETTSAELAAGDGLVRLESKLVEKGLDPRFDASRETIGAKPISADDLARLIRVFQQHVKSNGLTCADLQGAAAQHEKKGLGGYPTKFLEIYLPIAETWDQRLRDGNHVDFEDMMLLAAEHIENGAWKSPYTVILADEFQDSSRARIRLLKALAARGPSMGHLCVVGDDWQGINRFAGADISVMTEFETTFANATRLPLNTTFRCPQSLCDASAAFVRENPVQIAKTVNSASPYAKKSLLAFAFDDLSICEDHLADQLAQMDALVRDGRLLPNKGKRVTVLLLGRYRNDRPRGLEGWQRRYVQNLEISYRTVHSSKGLEADYVWVLNLVEGRRGFPSQIEDSPILQIAMPAPDPFPFAEERRLFYVALTRASKQVRLYTSLDNPSSFVIELAHCGAVKIEPVGGKALEPCPKCTTGVRRIRQGSYGPFEGCSRFPRCDYTARLPKRDTEKHSQQKANTETAKAE